MSRDAQITATVTFWAVMPDDDGEADTRADELSDGIRDAVHALPHVHDGSASVVELDEVEEVGND